MIDYDSLNSNEWNSLSEFSPSALSRYRIITRFFKKFNLSNKNVLEAGSSSGNLGIYIKKKLNIKNLSFCDFSIESVKLIKSKGEENVFQADLTEIGDFKEKSYNSIICSEVLEHIKDDNKAIQTLYKLLKKNGRIILSVPYSMKYWTIHDDFAGHIRRYEKKELSKKLSAQGFHVEKEYLWGSFFYNFYFYLLGNTNPKSIMNNSNKLIKRIISKILYYTFFLDDLLLFLNKGRRLFLVARK